MDLGSMMGLGAAGSLIGSIGNLFSQQNTNSQMQQAVVSQEQFQAQMSDTAHQREVADLKAAGLNPILSAGGSGSSTPMGGVPSLQAPQIQMPDIMNYGVQLKQLQQQDAKIAIDKANSASQIARNLSENQLTKMKSILAQRGIIPAQLEGQGAELLQGMINHLQTQAQTPDPKKLSEPSSGGSFPSDGMNFNQGGTILQP